MKISRFILPLVALASLAQAAFAQPIRPCVSELQTHVTAKNEDLFQIAQKYRLSVDQLAYANGFPITTIKVEEGTKLIIPTWRILPNNPPANGVVINLPERTIYLFRGGKFDRIYPISIGDEEAQKGRFATPDGNYKIIEKIKDPTWFPPSWAKDPKPVGPGPNNPLGDRWVGLSLPRTGIHGTNEPLNIGNSVTHGCMRTYPHLVREIFDLVEVGWPAVIEYETSKIGRTPSGELVFVTFPDVYKRSPTVPSLMKKLAAAHLTGKIKRKNFTSIAELNLGFPVSITASETVSEEVSHRLHWTSASR